MQVYANEQKRVFYALCTISRSEQYLSLGGIGLIPGAQVVPKEEKKRSLTNFSSNFRMGLSRVNGTPTLLVLLPKNRWSGCANKGHNKTAFIMHAYF